MLDLHIKEGEIRMSDIGYGGESGLAIKLDSDEVERVVAALRGEDE